MNLQALVEAAKQIIPTLQAIATLGTLGNFNPDGTISAQDWHLITDIRTGIASIGPACQPILRRGKEVATSTTLGFEYLKGQLERLGQSRITVDSATRLIRELSGIHRDGRYVGEAANGPRTAEAFCQLVAHQRPSFTPTSGQTSENKRQRTQPAPKLARQHSVHPHIPNGMTGLT